jgi:Rrf2 family protein
MPFKLTSASEYAIRLIVYLAELPVDTIVSVKEVAAIQSIPEKFLHTITTQLRKLHYINSFKGKGGGIQLARQAKDITMLEIVEALEGPISVNICTLDPSLCPFSVTCSVHNIWNDVHNSIKEILVKKTMADLAKENIIAKESYARLKPSFQEVVLNDD